MDKTVSQSNLIETLGTWLPIETAPKDGTRLLLWSDGAYEVAGYITQYREYEEDCGNGLYRKIKQECGYWDCEYAICPTHWMPLPAPPKST